MSRGRWKDDPLHWNGGYYTNTVYYSTDPKLLRFIGDDQAHDLTFLASIKEEGHFTHVGKYDNDAGDDWYFLTTDPDIRLSGWNKMTWPLQEAIDDAVMYENQRQSQTQKPNEDGSSESQNQ